MAVSQHCRGCRRRRRQQARLHALQIPLWNAAHSDSLCGDVSGAGDGESDGHGEAKEGGVVAGDSTFRVLLRLRRPHQSESAVQLDRLLSGIARDEGERRCSCVPLVRWPR